jgi:hypothetical protein
MTDVAEVEEIDFDAIENSKSTNSKSGNKKKQSPGDFPSLFADLFMKIPWKLAFFLFILFIILTSDVFIDKCLRKVPGSVSNMTSTNKGTIVQAIVLVLFFIILNGVISAGLI